MIKILDTKVADKIAAGEVIDRPVSIIKELVENSLDAGASGITVEIKNGGKSYIRVTDNGCGIDERETELAFMRHATSKIATAEDLDYIETLGFRGEALASICAVSRVELITRTAAAKTGRRVVVEGGDIIENTPVGCPEGTTVTVRDLFYNVPARRKFLASDNSESRRITEMFSRISLAHGNVRFSLVNNERSIFATRGNGSTLNDIINIYGSDTGRDLLPVHYRKNGFILNGYISPPSSSVPSRSRQVFCVNGRVVSSRIIEKALESAYREKLFHGRFPAAFLFFDVPPEKLDVNVHPAKKEIRFDNNDEIEEFTEEAVKDALAGKEALPQIKAETVVKINEPVTVYKEKNISEQTKDTELSGGEEQVDIKMLLSNLREKRDNDNNNDHSQINIEPEPYRTPFDFNELSCIGTVFNTYIVASDNNDLYLIDQHAAHERIFYEKLIQQYNNDEKSLQQLLIPFRTDAPAEVASSEESWIDSIRKIGYDIEFFGNNTYIVRAIPVFMEVYEAENFLKDFFLSLEEKPNLTDRRALEKIIMRSCKSAVKGGDCLKEIEIHNLIRDLSACVNPFSCPHGRPTFIRMTKREIEKMFKRV